ncbi:MAG TPA: cobalt-precorrin-6A reductase [Alphaproteobacteria bacterium]|nr:cobalt-precorrin-6A reductase [Alphaproteobacteria bacterium]
MSAARVLILGGTTEAVALAEALAREFGDRLEAITSLAGKTAAPRAVPGRVKSGGFGGAEGLAAYLRSERIDALVDATHPFAGMISAHAAEAAASAGVPRLVLTRAPWAAVAGDDWIEVPDAAGAVEALAARADLDRVFLTLGSGGIAPFAALGARFFAVRVAEHPARPVPLPNYALTVDRGPFSVEKEIALLEHHHIAAIVSKNAGGAATYPKIEAARTLRLPVVMIARPAPPEGRTVASVPDAVAWVARTVMRTTA